MHSKHRIYKMVLYLYPRSFRRHYGDEMVSVLDDLLADETDFVGRFLVWIRVGSELPFSIAQENLNNIGEKTMNKVVLKKNRRLIAAGVVGFMLIVGLLSATVLKDRLAFHYINIVYGTSMKREVNKQSELIGSPVKTLSNGKASENHGCNLYMAPAMRSQLICDTSTSQYIKTKDMANQEQVLKNIDTIESKLKEQGYTSGSNGVTLKSLVEGTYQGKDYSPDAFYEKKIGKYDCTFDTQIAYSNPAEPAINTMFSCVRTFDL